MGHSIEENTPSLYRLNMQSAEAQGRIVQEQA